MKSVQAFTLALLAASTLLLPAQSNKPNAAATAALTGAEQAVGDLEFAWATAVKQRDIESIDRLQADEFQFTDPAGRVWTKAESIDAIKAGNLEIDSFEVSSVRVKIYGRTAVASFAIAWTGRYRGADISGPQRMTDVFVKRSGHWQCVASQATRIRMN